jgi:two-component system, chemotaxis family, chemotaxis protein CheY
VRTCLIVDDSPVIRKIARRIVEDMGFDPTEAADGQQALDRCRLAMPDAVLLDWRMPEMNGLEFMLALRKEPGGDRPKVIFCSEENDLARIREALEAGADEFIMKPFDGDIVASKFATAGLL